MTKPRGTKKVFYGWYIVAACFVMAAMSYGAINNCLGIFIKPVCTDMGFTRAQMGGISTIMAAAQMVMALLSGRLFARFSVAIVVRIAGIVMSLGYFSFSLAQNLMSFYASALVTGIAIGAITSVSISMLISNWFHAKRGFAVGLAFMGSGIGGMICNPLASALIISGGWRATYQILATIVFILVVPASFLILRAHPSDKGLTPYGESDDEVYVPATDGLTLSDAMQTKKFWVLCACAALNTICTSGLMQNTAPHISDVGFSPTFAASVASAGMAALALGKLALGYLYDKLGVRGATLLSHGFAILALVGALMAPFMPGIALIVIGTSLGGAFGTVASPIIAQVSYGHKDYGAILGVMSAFTNVGGMLTPILVGGSYDALGSYKPAFTVMIALVAIIMACYIWAFRSKPQNIA